MRKKTKSPYLESFEKSRRSKWANQYPNLLFLTQSRGNIHELRGYQTTEYHPQAHNIAPPPSSADAESAPVFHPDVVARASALLQAVLAFASSAPLAVTPSTSGHAALPSASSSAPAVREPAANDAFPALVHAIASPAPVTVAPASVGHALDPARAAPTSSSSMTPAAHSSTGVDLLGAALDTLTLTDP